MNPYATFLVGASLLLMLLTYIGTAVHKTKRLVGTLLVALATAAALYTVNALGIKLGIDLQGGSEFIVQLKPGQNEDGSARSVSPVDVQQAIAILENRLNPGSEKDLALQPEGADRIVVQMPGISDEDIADVRNKIQQVAKLEFRRVHPQSASKLAEIKARGTPEPGWVEMSYTKKKEGEADPAETGSELVRSTPDLEGDIVADAYRVFDAEGNKVVLKLNSTGAKRFDELAEMHYGNQMAIIVDGQIHSAPALRAKQFGGTAEISGGAKGFTEVEADTLGTLLNNPLRNPLVILSESSVSSAYGESSINQGKWVGAVALGLTTLFMLFIYRAAGIVAIIGLIINMALLFGTMSLFGFTLTMPGIAGLVLTIGMAVDANVLIYERLREEMEGGKTFAAALEAAYDKAFSAIADSNVTTLISAIILFVISGGLVKGFAVTLMIGLLTSLVGALIVTRVIFMWIVDKGILKGIHALRIIPDKVFDILSIAPKFIIASLVVTAISFGTLAVKGSHSLGIDFRGGGRVDVVLKPGKDITDAELDAVIKPLKSNDGQDIGTYYIQRKTDPATGAENLSIRCEEKSSAPIQAAITAKWKEDTLAGTSIATVGSLVGTEAATRSLWAMAAALVAIFLYLLMRYEVGFALGAILALFHDVLMVPGLCVLFGQELSIIHVGALLTIAGYSINDTIVVFDRIRETIQRGGGGTMRELMNEAICKTLSRTLLTGPTALAPMIVLLFLGNPAMLEFAMPITIGVLLGTYSSIFIASPLVLWYAKKTGTSLKRQVLDAQVEQMKAQQAIAAAAASSGKA